MNSLSSITSAMYNAVRPKTSAETLEKQLISLMTRMSTTCNCGGEEVVAVCKANVDMGVRSIMTGNETAANRILNNIFTMEKIQELSAKGKLDPALAKDIQKFLKAVNTFVPVTLLNKEVYAILEQAQQPGWLTPENTLQPPPAFTLHVFETLNRFLKLPEYTLLHNTNLIPKEKVDVEAKIKPKASAPEGNAKTEALKKPETAVKSVLAQMGTENLSKTPHIQKPTTHPTQPLRPTELPKKQAFSIPIPTENNTPNTSPQTQDMPSGVHSARQETMTWLQNQLQNHTEKTLNTGQKVIALISEKAPEALAVVHQTLEHLSQMPPKSAETNMNTLANVIAHVGKADSTQLHPTLTTLHSLIHLPSETLTTVGHSLALVAKQQPEQLPVIRALLESVPQTAKTLTAVAHIILAGIEATPHARQEGTSPRTLPSLAAVAMTMAKISPENLSPVATTLINVAQTHPEVVPQLTQALNVIATKSPETLNIIPQLIQTVSTQPDSLPKLATTLIALGNTATPQQITQSIHQITMTLKDSPATLPLLLDVLHTAVASPQHSLRPLFQKTEDSRPILRHIESGSRHTSAPQIQTAGIAQQPAQTPLSQLRAQKALNLTQQLINNTVTTAPETLPLLLTIFKSSASQPLISTKILTVLQDIQQQHPKDMPKVVKALSNFAQSAPQHLSKATNLMSSVLTKSPQTLAPLATALQIISTGPITLQKEALKHLDMARNKNMQTLHHSCREMAKLEIPPRSDSATLRPNTPTSAHVISEPATLLTPLPNTESRHFHLETTALSPNKETGIQQKSLTPTPATNDHPSEPTSRESVAKALPTLRETPLNAPQTTHKAEVPSQPGRETTQQTRPQTNVTPMQTLALFGQISAQSPRDLPATRMTVATITTKAPAALGQTFAAISAVGTHAPQHLAAVVTLLSAIADKGPTALTQVATALSDIATRAPQHLDRAIALLSAIADKAPAALAQVATALSDIATHAPQHLDRAIALLSAIADKAPSTLAQIATSLHTLAKKSPELFTMVLEIGHKIADKAPELLPKFAQFLTQFHDTLHTDKLHTQLMALMQALAAEASEESTHLLQKLLNLGELKAAEDPALHAYVSSEIKKTRDKAKKAQANNVAKQSSTDQLIHMFDRMEMENWKLAAMFRKSLQGAQLS